MTQPLISIPYSSLGAGFADPVQAADFPKHSLRFRNNRAASSIGLDVLSDAEWLAHFGHFKPLPNNLTAPLALRYHGHQFRQYNPQLGDGRGFLFAQYDETTPYAVIDDQTRPKTTATKPQNRLLDLGTKGSGTTPYSRGGDGRLTLKGGIREILASEMLEALGANSSRSLSLIETGESLLRGDEPSPTRSSVLVRLTHSHIRLGSFQYHAYHQDAARLSLLSDYCLQHYFTYSKADLAQKSPAEKALCLLDHVCRTSAYFAADLMVAGFVHGVLNTDNINITGEIFDFGPWRFLPETHMNFTAAYFDETGLYSYGRQPEAVFWALCQFAGCLRAFVDDKELEKGVEPFPAYYIEALRFKTARRLGTNLTSPQEDDELFKDIGRFLSQEQAVYGQFFFDWYGGIKASARAQKSPQNALYTKADYRDLFARLKARAPHAKARLDHAYFQGSPCLMRIEQVEAVWAPIAANDDWHIFEKTCHDIRFMGEALRLD